MQALESSSDVESLLDTVDLPPAWRTGVRPGLEAALRAVASDDALSTDGRATAHAMFADHLRRLAAIAADRKRYPEIAAVKIDRPVFILGLPRCGTSMLHAVMGADPALRAPRMWEVASPSPPPDEGVVNDPRIAAFDAYIEEAMTGEWDEIPNAHPLGALVPQECGLILETAFQGINPVMYFGLPDFYDWYRQADTRFGYEVHKAWLQHLGWRTPRDRWVLKVQEHMYHLPELLSVYPDALFVQPHRDPVTVIASISRLLQMLRSPVTKDTDLRRLGREMLHLWNDGQVKMMAYRAEYPELRVHDIRYKDLVADPIGTVRGIYDFADLAFTAKAENGIRHWLADNPAGKHGKHRYALEDYGVTEDEVREVYADYIATYRDFI